MSGICKKKKRIIIYMLPANVTSSKNILWVSYRGEGIILIASVKMSFFLISESAICEQLVWDSLQSKMCKLVMGRIGMCNAEADSKFVLIVDTDLNKFQIVDLIFLECRSKFIQIVDADFKLFQIADLIFFQIADLSLYRLRMRI